MDNIGKIVSDAWSFLLGPVVVTAILLGLTFFLARDKLRNILSHLRNTELVPNQNDPLYKILEAYGITKILPIAVLFAIIFSLHAANVSLRLVGSIVPGEIVYLQDKLLMHVNHGALEATWAAYPQLQLPHEVARHAIVLIEAAKEKQPSVFARDSNHWDNKHDDSVSRFDLVKAYVALALCITIIQLKRPGNRLQAIRRFLVVLMLGIIFGGFYFFQQLYALEQRAYADMRVLTAVLELDSTGPPKGSHEVDPERLGLLQRMSEDSHRQWWEVQFGDSYFFYWIIRTINGRSA